MGDEEGCTTTHWLKQTTFEGNVDGCAQAAFLVIVLGWFSSIYQGHLFLHKDTHLCGCVFFETPVGFSLNPTQNGFLPKKKDPDEDV